MITIAVALVCQCHLGFVVVVESREMSLTISPKK